ncbi:MAG: hypothetical protein ACR2PO_00790 [Methyloligellaceae bacterium]
MTFRFVLTAICIALSVVAVLGSRDAVALPLDKQACATLTAEHDRLVRAGVLKTMGKGPDWAAANLKPDGIAQIKRFLTVEAKIRFQCRGDGVAIAKLVVKPPAGVKKVETRGPMVPLPKRNEKKKPLIAGAVPAFVPPKAKPLYAAAAIPNLALQLQKHDSQRTDEETGGSIASESTSLALAQPEPQKAAPVKRAGPVVPLPLRKPKVVRRAVQTVRGQTAQKKKPVAEPKFEDQPINIEN